MQDSWIEVLVGILLSDEAGTPRDLTPWTLTSGRDLPADILTLADPMDPLAQARLWSAVYPELPRGFLVQTCLVESGCERPVGVHQLDAHRGPSVWQGVWARGKVDKACAFYKAPGEADEAWLQGASTRGNMGLMSAYHVTLVGDCVPLSALDIPFFSAWAAAEKASRYCAALRTKKKRCTPERLRCAWAHAKLGSSKCGRVIKRWRKHLAHKREQFPDIDPSKHYTLRHFRNAAAARKTLHADHDAQGHDPSRRSP